MYKCHFTIGRLVLSTAKTIIMERAGGSKKDNIESKLRLEIPAVLNYIEKKNKFHTLQKG